MINKMNLKKSILYYIFFISIYEIPLLTRTIPITNTIYNILQLLVTIVILILAIKKTTISKIIIYISCYFFIYILSTMINNGEIISCIFESIKIITLCLLIDFSIKKDLLLFLEKYERFLFLLIIINLATIILFPEGMYTTVNLQYTSNTNWFLGYRNSQILYILQLIFISFIRSYHTHDKLTIKTYLYLIISILSIIKVQSTTSLVGIVIITIMLLLHNKLKKMSKINIYHYTLSYIFIYFAIVVYRIQNQFNNILIAIFNKSSTFTGRTAIWDYVWEFIKSKKWLGYGLENSNYRIAKTTYLQSYHAHNQILEIIYKTGFIGLFMFIIIYISTIRKIYDYRYEKIGVFMTIFIFAYLIIMLTEAYDLIYFVPLLVFEYNIKYLVYEVKCENKKIIKKCN